MMFSLLLVVVVCRCVFFFFKQKTAYEMRISDWSSDVCSSDLFKLLLTRDNYLCVALTPMLSHDIPNCPILRAGYGKPCQLFDVVGATDADKRARSSRGREWRSSSARTRTRWTRRGGFPSRLRSALR